MLFLAALELFPLLRKCVLMAAVLTYGAAVQDMGRPKTGRVRRTFDLYRADHEAVRRGEKRTGMKPSHLLEKYLVKVLSEIEAGARDVPTRLPAGPAVTGNFTFEPGTLQRLRKAAGATRFAQARIVRAAIWRMEQELSGGDQPHGAVDAP